MQVDDLETRMSIFRNVVVLALQDGFDMETVWAEASRRLETSLSELRDLTVEYLKRQGLVPYETQ